MNDIERIWESTRWVREHVPEAWPKDLKACSARVSSTVTDWWWEQGYSGSGPFSHIAERAIEGAMYRWLIHQYLNTFGCRIIKYDGPPECYHVVMPHGDDVITSGQTQIGALAAAIRTIHERTTDD